MGRADTVRMNSDRRSSQKHAITRRQAVGAAGAARTVPASELRTSSGRGRAQGELGAAAEPAPKQTKPAAVA